MTAVQPELDLFAEPAAAPIDPATCPACGTTEASGYLLRANHGFDPGTLAPTGHPDREQMWGGRCLAQVLTERQLHFAAERDRPELEALTDRARRIGLDATAIVAAARKDTP